MPTKKTTTKKTVNKKPATKKTGTRRVITKKPAIKKSPEVIVKENVIKKDNYTTSSCTKAKGILIAILLVINTILLGLLVFRTTTNTALFTAMEDFEAMRVGGQENHQIMKEIYQLDAYKNDQKMRLETTLNALKNMNLNPTTGE